MTTEDIPSRVAFRKRPDPDCPDCGGSGGEDGDPVSFLDCHCRQGWAIPVENALAILRDHHAAAGIEGNLMVRCAKRAAIECVAEDMQLEVSE